LKTSSFHDFLAVQKNNQPDAKFVAKKGTDSNGILIFSIFARIFTCVVQLLKLQSCCTCTGSLIRLVLDKLQRVVDILFLSDPAGVLSH
jgi:hypothetical protein